jgi:XTP/dITP diphosphohydrolase
MTKDILLASANRHKIIELSDVLSPLGYHLIPQTDKNIRSIEETGLTFIENAIIKARHACKQSGMPAIADDSGLEVAALDGRPGIYSARFAGEHASDQDNLQALLDALVDVPPEKRQANFRCVLVMLKSENDPAPLIAQGIWPGTIATSASGIHGFGYDPIFHCGEKKCSVATLSRVEKNKISHRAKALKDLVALLKNNPLT